MALFCIDFSLEVSIFTNLKTKVIFFKVFEGLKSELSFPKISTLKSEKI